MATSSSLSLALLVVLHLLATLGHAQLSAPISDDSHISVDGNKFLQRKADLDKEESSWADDEEALLSCPQNVELKWMSEVSSSIYATPLITDLFSDGTKDIVVPSFVHYLEVLEGSEGGQLLGWPAFHKSTVHASPLLHDINFDGVRDVMVATYNGEILFYRDTGEQLRERMQVSRLRVRKGWYTGLNPDNVDLNHPKVEKKKGVAAGGAAGGGSAHGNAQPLQGGSHALEAPPPGLLPQSGQHSNVTLDDRVTAVLQRMASTKKQFGDAAMKQLLHEVKTKDGVLYDAVLARIKRQQQESQQAGGKAQAQRQSVKRRGSDDSSPVVQGGKSPVGGATTGKASKGGTLQARRRSLLAVADSADGGSGIGAERDPTHELSEEAVESFDVFKNDGGDSSDGSGDIFGDGGGFGASDGDGDGDGDRDPLLDADGNIHGDVGDNTFFDGSLDNLGAGGGGDRFDADRLHHNLEDAPPGPSDDEQLFPGEAWAYDELGERFKTLADDPGVEADIEELRNSNSNGAVETDLEAEQLRYHRQYTGDYHDRLRQAEESMKQWEEESFEQARHAKEQEYVYVDAHVLCTPAIGDLDGDGHEELVLAVSYFYDREYYEDPAHAPEVQGLDVGKYIASGIAVFDLRTRQEKWVQHLDLSTDSTALKAYAYSSPTLADLDGDGTLEIVVGTSLGFLYVLDHKGAAVEGWPVQMGEIQGQPLVADLDNDGELEIFVGDTRGNIAAYGLHGQELWERHVRSLISQGATAADVNGDGALEVVFGTSSGHLYAVQGATGLDIPNFPFRTRGRVHAPVLVTRLLDGPSQHLIATSFDGFLYMVDGGTGCADSIDLGESSYAMVLADDLDGNGRLDLLVATMNGNIYALETPAEYHPLKAWTSQTLGPNGQTARHDYFGVYASEATRRPRDVAGDKLAVRLTVVDKRQVFAENGSLTPSHGGPYNVSVVLKGVGVREMAAGHQPVIGVADTLPGPGTYQLEVPCPRTRTSATVRLELVERHGLIVSDEFAISFHLHFHKLLKWMVALPLAAMVLILVAVTAAQDRRSGEDDALRLPDFQAPHDS